LIHAEARNDRNLFIALAQRRYRITVDRRGGRTGYIQIRDASKIRAVSVDPELYVKAVFPPIVPYACCQGNFLQYLFDIVGSAAQSLNILARNPDGNWQAYGVTRLQLTHVDSRAGNFTRYPLLDVWQDVMCVVSVFEQ
jgi:hypothetical protein